MGLLCRSETQVESVPFSRVYSTIKFFEDRLGATQEGPEFRQHSLPKGRSSTIPELLRTRIHVSDHCTDKAKSDAPVDYFCLRALICQGDPTLGSRVI